MKDMFLYLLRVKDETTPNDLTELINYYKSTDLIDTISSLINKKLTPVRIRGKRILLKPNWVKHSSSPNDDLCLRTHDNFIVAALIAFLKAGPSEVIIGDAPIQGCKWDKMISKFLIEKIDELSHDYNIPIKLKDFRRRTYDISDNSPDSGLKPLSDYLIFNLGKNSLLEPVTKPGKTRFRVTNYDPDRMVSAHAPGVHKYCITREFFKSDIVVSLPKIKTHEKTGVTGALKNMVGINGDKDFLPHHRIGGEKLGGDCYPGGSYLRYLSELAMDKANRRQGRRTFWYWQKLSSLLWVISRPGAEHSIAAGWHGNDTTWRMVLDVNKIAEFGREDGTIAEKPERQILSLCDGIIAGQGDGPLNPEPLPLGIISFTNSPVNNDTAMALLMDMPVDKIPLLRYGSIKWDRNCEVTFNGNSISIEALKQYSIKALPPKGWRNYFRFD